MTEPNISKSNSKFTRGEKCIFTHIVLTFCLLLAFVIVYLVHLYVVDHNLNNVFNTRRAFIVEKVYSELEDFPIGLLYLNTNPLRTICNTLLVKKQWSLSTGHCVAIRSEPDLSHLLINWRIFYNHDNSGLNIKRSIVHQHFNSDTFTNNIGLIQHDPARGMMEYTTPNYIATKSSGKNEKIVIIDWQYSTSRFLDIEKKIQIYPVRRMSTDKCSTYTSQFVELRSYEFCVVFQKKTNNSVGYGALIIHPNNFKVLGIFSWGEKLQRSLPFVILNYTYFVEWIKTTTENI